VHKIAVVTTGSKRGTSIARTHARWCRIVIVPGNVAMLVSKDLKTAQDAARKIALGGDLWSLARVL
jgi:hypothetical protein